MNSREDETAARQTRFVLASASPRRRTLLQQVGIEPVCRAVNIDETPLADESPADLVLRLAGRKASECAILMMSQKFSPVSDATDTLIIGADTIIDFQGRSLGKPRDREDAVNILLKLSTREHFVHTGVAVYSTQQRRMLTGIVSTTVRFGSISEDEAIRYWETGEPADKAGAYGIQGLGARYVAHMDGSYSNVVGLPLYETLNLIEKIGLPNSSDK